jgi:hypothetical protein
MKPMAHLKARATKAMAGQGAASLMLLGACAVLGPTDQETTRTYRDVAPDALYDRTVQALQTSDLEIIEADRASGVITAAGRFDQRGWATCSDSLMLVNDQGGEGQMVEAPEQHREVKLVAAVIDAPEGARLTLEPAFRSEPVGAMATSGQCRTTGRLENEILEAVAAQA